MVVIFVKIQECLMYLCSGYVQTNKKHTFQGRSRNCSRLGNEPAQNGLQYTIDAELDGVTLLCR